MDMETAKLVGWWMYAAFIVILACAVYSIGMNEIAFRWGVRAYERECEAGKVPVEERRQRAEVRWACKWWSPAWWRLVRSWKEDK